SYATCPVKTGGGPVRHNSYLQRLLRMVAQVGFGASISGSDCTYQLVGFGAPNWPSLYGLLRVTTMPESVRNNARIPTYPGCSNQVEVAGGDRAHSRLEVKQRSIQHCRLPARRGCRRSAVAGANASASADLAARFGHGCIRH